jgi:hypothetical protein
MSEQNINLEFLKRLMQDLESCVNDAANEKLRDPQSSNYQTLIAKSLARAYSISHEAMLLAEDIAGTFSNPESCYHEQVIKSILPNKNKSQLN